MTMSPGDRPIEVLLVEDDPADARLTQETLKGSEHRLNVAVAEDGQAAMAYLRQEGEHSSAPRPDLVLLDLKLPKKSGEEVLEEMNQDPHLVQIPVMILTSTRAERIRLATYDIPPGRYFEKPLDLKLFHQALGRPSLFSGAPIRMSSPEPQTTPQSEEQGRTEQEIVVAVRRALRADSEHSCRRPSHGQLRHTPVAPVPHRQPLRASAGKPPWTPASAG